jgi:hypothetical protein
MFAVDFESTNPTVVKSIKQRDLLNTWLRLYARQQRLPRRDDYKPERIADEAPDMVHYSVDAARQPPRLIIESDGTRMSNAYGNTGRGKSLEDYIGPRLVPQVMPIYYACIDRRLPVYTISTIEDMYGRVVAYERLLMPFSESGLGEVTHITASLKTISEDGSFEIRNLMRDDQKLPTQRFRGIIDRDLVHRVPSRIPADDIIEFG